MHTHYLTWITMGDIGSAITTPIADGLEAHERHVTEAAANYPDDEDGGRPELHIGKTYFAIAYRDLPDERTDGALDGSDPELEHVGHEQFGDTWYSKVAA